MTTINDILGDKCIFKARMPHDKCRDCSGYSSHPVAHECDDYLSHKTHQEMSSYIAIKIRLQQIRDANDRGVI